MKKLFTLILVIVFILSGCQGNNNDSQKQSETQAKPLAHTSLTTVSDLKKKYKEEEQYLTPMYNVNYNQVFTIKFNSNIYSTNAFPHSEQDLAELFTEDDEERFNRNIATVHTDARCLYESEVPTFEEVKDPGANKSILTVSSNAPVLTSFNSTRDTENSWGNAPIYYICIRYDLDAQTPTKLDYPIIIPFTVKSPLQSPNAKYQIDAEGRYK